MGEFSFVQNKSMRRLFTNHPTTNNNNNNTLDSLNQSSDFDSSSLLVRHNYQHSRDSVEGQDNNKKPPARQTHTNSRGQSSIEEQPHAPSKPHQRCFKNSHVLTSTPIRNARQSDQAWSPAVVSAPHPPNVPMLNYTFPMRHQPTTIAHNNPQHHQQQHHQLQTTRGDGVGSGGHRKQAANKTISLGEFMGGPPELGQFPALVHNANNNRRKTQSTANVSAVVKGSPQVGTGSTTHLEKSGEKSMVANNKQSKPRRRVVPISLSTGGGGGNKRNATLSPFFSSSSSTPSISPAVAPVYSQSASCGPIHEHGFGVEFINSPFRNTNNLLSVQGEEQDQQSAMHERQLLREERAAIETDFIAETAANSATAGNLRSAVANLLSSAGNEEEMMEGAAEWVGQVDFQAAFTELLHKDKLDVCAEIYSLILNLNLTWNVLTEVTFLLTIINMGPSVLGACGVAKRFRHMSVGEDALVDADDSVQIAMENTHMPFEVLFLAPLNCMYLAVQVLSRQRGPLLTMLDAKTLRVLIENEKLMALNAELLTYLQDIYRLKGELELRYYTEFGGQQNRSAPQEGLDGGKGGGQQSVFYQAEDDTRDNFPTQNEFVAFKKQRDLFYVILRMWEERHLHSNWNFNQELGGRIRYLFVVMPHPINMAHLARLFTSQLIVCCQNWNNVEQNAAQAELLQRFQNVDLSRLSKLEQRFVQPGSFSAELQFPGIQVFFKEFIVAAESSAAFVEQLKIALMAELISLNDSTYEVVNVSTQVRGQVVNETVVSGEDKLKK